MRLLLAQRNKEDIASDVGAHDLHDLGLGDVLHAGDFNVVAGLDAEPPGVLAVAVKSKSGDRQSAEHSAAAMQAHKGDWQFSWESNCDGRKRAFVRAKTGIPRSHPGLPGARHRVPRARGALGGYNSSCMMVEPLFRAIKSGQLS